MMYWDMTAQHRFLKEFIEMKGLTLLLDLLSSFDFDDRCDVMCGCTVWCDVRLYCVETLSTMCAGKALSIAMYCAVCKHS